MDVLFAVLYFGGVALAQRLHLLNNPPIVADIALPAINEPQETRRDALAYVWHVDFQSRIVFWCDNRHARLSRCFTHGFDTAGISPKPAAHQILKTVLPSTRPYGAQVRHYGIGDGMRVESGDVLVAAGYRHKVENGISLQRIAPDGRPANQGIRIPTGPNYFLWEIRCVLFPDGRIAVVALDPGSSTFYLQFFSGEGEVLTELEPLFGTERVGDFAATTTAEGNLALLWTADDMVSLDIFNDRLERKQATIAIPAAQDRRERRKPSIVSLPSRDSYLLAWESNSASRGRRQTSIEAAVVTPSASGAPNIDIWELPALGAASEVRLAVGPTKALAVWFEDTERRAVVAHEIGLDGLPIGERIVLGFGAFRPPGDFLSVEWSTAGKFQVAWKQRGPTSE